MMTEPSGPVIPGHLIFNVAEALGEQQLELAGPVWAMKGDKQIDQGDFLYLAGPVHLLGPLVHHGLEHDAHDRLAAIGLKLLKCLPVQVGVNKVGSGVVDVIELVIELEDCSSASAEMRRWRCPMPGRGSGASIPFGLIIS